MKYLIIIGILTLLITGCASDQVLDEGEEINETEYETEFVTEAIATSLQNPWGLAFIDNETAIITEKVGNIKIINITSREINTISGAPTVTSSGQGGLLDIELDNEWIYLTYTASNGDGIATHLGRGTLNLESRQLENFEILKIATPPMSGGAHFGSRILIKDEYVFFTTGDRGRKDFGLEHVSQDRRNELGSVLRLYKNGSVPENNPFAQHSEFSHAIYSYGHRNPQGITLHPQTGEIWLSEHGEQDGDAIHIIEAGGNYGWPIAHYGCEYFTGRIFAQRPDENPDIVNPIYYWECGSGGFPPAGMTFYTGDKFEDWQGNLFIGTLAGEYLGRFEVNGREVQELEPLLANGGWRIRDVKESPDGYLYVLVDGNPGMLIKLKPY